MRTPSLRPLSSLAFAAVVVTAWTAPIATPAAARQQQGTPKQLIVTLHVTDKKDVPLGDIAPASWKSRKTGRPDRF